MQATATDFATSVVCLARDSPAKTAKPIEMLFGK